jgi:CheY-like chemotaxis protein
MSKKVILLADEDRWYVEPFVEELRDGNYIVEQSSTGQETIEKIEQMKIDLLILDVMMPAGGGEIIDKYGGRRTGIRVAQYLRSKKIMLPIIYLTVIADPHVHSLIQKVEKDAGIDDPLILIKPISPDDLLEDVDQVLNENE